MDARQTSSRSQITVAQPRRGRLRGMFEWWWNLDRRRHIERLGKHDRLHPLDETHVVEAMARQLEEIRNLPDAAC